MGAEVEVEGECEDDGGETECEGVNGGQGQGGEGNVSGACGGP